MLDKEPISKLCDELGLQPAVFFAAVSPTGAWRVLSQAGLLSKWNGKPSKKGTGFEQPLAAHQHWHIDVSYIDISGTFYYLCSILDGCSRYIVNWDLRESMTEADIEIIIGAGQGTSSGGAATDHLRQRTAVHRQGLQGVHSDLGHDPRPNFALLSAIERKDRTLAQIAQRRVHPAGNAPVAGRRAASGAGLRRALQQRPPEQCHRPTSRRRTCSPGVRLRLGRQTTNGEFSRLHPQLCR